MQLTVRVVGVADTQRMGRVEGEVVRRSIEGGNEDHRQRLCAVLCAEVPMRYDLGVTESVVTLWVRLTELSRDLVEQLRKIVDAAFEAALLA